MEDCNGKLQWKVVDNCMLALEADQGKVVDNLIKNMIKNFSDYLKFFLE